MSDTIQMLGLPDLSQGDSTTGKHFCKYLSIVYRGIANLSHGDTNSKEAVPPTSTGLLCVLPRRDAVTAAGSMVTNGATYGSER